MLEMIRKNLHRQAQALRVLFALLEEEFSLLQQGEPESVSGNEMSIQELIRQIAMERVDLKTAIRNVLQQAAPGQTEISNPRISDMLAVLPEEEHADINMLLQRIDDEEQNCARQAEKNQTLAMALLEQSRSLVDFIHERVSPKQEDVYVRNGRYAQAQHHQGSLLRKRM